MSRLLVNYLKLCLESKFDEVRHHLSQLPNCINWLDPNFKITPAPRDDDSDSSSDSGSDEDMEMSSDEDEAPVLVEPNQRQRNKPQTDEDGWTTVPSRRR